MFIFKLIFEIFCTLSCIDSWDCTAGSCGNFYWWVTTLTPTKQAYLHLGSGTSAATCKDKAVIATALTPLICKCPQFDYYISPCFCKVTPPLSSSSTLTITCAPLTDGGAGLGVSDTRMAEIIAKTPATTPLDNLLLNFNNLTQVPVNLNQYTTLTYLTLAHNSISSITATSTTFPATLITLDASFNLMTQAPTGLNQYTEMSTLLLNSNSIGNFVSSFSPALATLDLSSNLLTMIPSGFAQYTALVSLNLALNQITTVASNDLKMAGSVQLIDLSFNQITSVPDAAFPANYASGAKILMQSNHQMKSFNRLAFEPVIQSFIASSYSASTTYIDVSNTSLWDCTWTSCGGFNWWVAMNSTAKDYVRLGSGSTAAKCSDGTIISTTNLTPIICKCPTYALDIAPCLCVPTTDKSSGTTVTLKCDPSINGDSRINIDDVTMAGVIGNVSASTPLDTINLSSNQLTQVPASLTQYTQLVSVSLASNNITFVDVNQLNLTASVQLIDLSSNQITNVAAGVFPSIFFYSSIFHLHQF